MRRLLSAILGVALLAAVGATGGPAHGASARPAVAGVTVLEGSQTAVTHVRVSQDTTLIDPRFNPGDGFSVTGSSALVGFALVSDQPQPEIVLVGGRLPWAVSADSSPTTVLMPLRGLDFSDRYSLPAGDYRLYLLTDGQPARVTLQFEGLTGETLLEPGQPVPYDIRTPGPRDSTPSESTYYASGDHATMQSNGLVFASRFSRYASYVSDREEGCFYERATDRSTDFGPGCLPDGFPVAFTTATLTRLVDESTDFSYGGVSGLEAGRTYGVGFNAETVGVVKEHRFFSLYLNYEPAAPSPAPPTARPTEAFCAAVEPDYEPFRDITRSPFAAPIECAAFSGIARGGPSGLDPDQYGPGLTTSRAQMASLVARLIDAADAVDSSDGIRALPPYDGTPAFTDVRPDDPHFESINRLAQAGVVSGGPQGRLPTEYGPGLPVSRAQMATFLNRAVGWMTGSPITAGGDYFTDDEGSAHEANINAVASVGIAVGDGARTFSAARDIPRDQLAAFLVRGLALLHADDRIGPAERA